jgi:hypothetical protein
VPFYTVVAHQGTLVDLALVARTKMSSVQSSSPPKWSPYVIAVIFGAAILLMLSGSSRPAQGPNSIIPAEVGDQDVVKCRFL